MKKLSILILFCFSFSAYAQEPINLQCFVNGKSFGFLRLFPDRNEVVKEGQNTTIQTSWSQREVTIYTDIAGPFTTERVNRETLAYTYIEHVLDDKRTYGMCKLIETKNQI
jgi:hypothetical protein